MASTKGTTERDREQNSQKAPQTKKNKRLTHKYIYIYVYQLDNINIKYISNN